MCPSSDPHLDIEIQMCEQRLALLKELKELREKKKEKKIYHYPMGYVYVKKGSSRIKRVACNCGEVTNYKIPLLAIQDFKCPKDPDKESKLGKV